MNAAAFNQLIEQPSLLKDVSIDELCELKSRYPFCASVHLLLLKKYQVEKHHDFDACLSLTAAYANDRKALYRLLYDEAKFRQTEEATAMSSHEQRVGTEILLGNESGAFADYTPKNKVAEIETYESMDFIKTGWADDLLSLESENTDRLNAALQEQFLLANEKAGGGAEINHDFDNLEEENEDELLEEKIEAELESTKAFEGALENAVEERNYNELASLSSSGAELTHQFDGLAEENETELFEENLDVELESTKALEGAIEHAIVEPDYKELAATVSQNGIGKHESEPTAEPTEKIPTTDVPEQQRDIPSDPLEHSNVEHEESPSPKEEITETPQEPDNEQISTSANSFEPSEHLAEILYVDELETNEEDTSDQDENETEELSLSDVLASNRNDEQEQTENLSTENSNYNITDGETYSEQSGIDESAAVEIPEEANLPTSLEEHEIKPEELEPTNELQDEHTATNVTADLTPRQEINEPMSEEDLVGTSHRKITHETEASYRTDDQKTETVPTATHQGVELQGTKTFTDWLKLFNPKQEETKPDIIRPDQKVGNQISTELKAPQEESALHETDETDDTLYDREWKARKLEMESWTAGLPDELKVIDEFVAQHGAEKQTHQPVSSVAELAQRSLEENDSFLTETMAKVYAAQGKYKKAVDVVEKLMLKNPAKRLYFADLLEEYKKKITS